MNAIKKFFSAWAFSLKFLAYWALVCCVELDMEKERCKKGL